MANSFEIVVRVGVSTKSVSDAISNAVKEANAEKAVSWFEVIEQRGALKGDEVEFQVKLKVAVEHG